MKGRVIITGSAGFIGFHVGNRLVAEGYQVLGVDNFNDYYDPMLKRMRVENSSFPTKPLDLIHKDQVASLIAEWKPTHILHLAAQAGVRYSLEAPEKYLESNIFAFHNLLDILRTHPHIRFVYASSSSVYGSNTKVPFSVEDRTENQASLYGVTKKTGELLAKTYHHLFGIRSVGLRYFTVYGPWGRPDMAYFSFAEKIMRDEPIALYNEGMLSRDFTYIDDIVEGTVRALEVEKECVLYNLGRNDPVALLTFIETLEKALGKQAKKTFCPMQKGDVFHTYADISTSVKDLHFSPKVSLSEGLERFAKWYLSYKERCRLGKTA
jgi:UDP-glucuronate 4-epimerase